jgi:DNA-binding CsgD family transcriptional regulator
MKNFADSDYAINKNAEGIVYRFADQTFEVTLEDYLRENPGKTAADFTELKTLSDEDYYESDRRDYRQTWKNVSLDGLENTTEFSGLSSEDEFISKTDQIAELKRRNELAQKALDKLTDVQRRRYIQHRVDGLSTWQIAEIEGTNQKSVYECLQAAEKKIKKVLSGG